MSAAPVHPRFFAPSCVAVPARVLGVLLLAGCVGCGSTRPADAAASATAVAEATSTRRAAQATVQRIIAGAPTATPVPQSTPSPAPGCPGAIWWHQARSHVGESRTVEGPVVATRAAPGALAMLEIGQPYPDPAGLAVIVPVGAAPGFAGKMLCVAGAIENDAGTSLIRVREPASIVVVG